MTTRLLLLPMLSLPWVGAVPAFAAIITWTGYGDGVSWEIATNWTGGVKPGLGDDVVIAGGLGTNVILSNAVTVQSIQSDRAVTIRGGSYGGLTVTAGASLLSGSLRIASGRSLSAGGTNTTFTCTGPVTADGANLYASEGGQISLPGLSSSYRPADFNSDWSAFGAGSVLDLPGLTNFSSASFDGYNQTGAWVDASAGGQVLLTNLATCSGWSIGFSVLDAGLVDLSRLSALACEAGSGSIGMRGGTATLRAPLTNIDNVSISLRNGAVLSLPGVRSYAGVQSWNGYATLAVSGSGSRIVLTNVTTLGASAALTAYGAGISVVAGGRVELGAATNLAAGATLSVRASGVGSTADLSSLNQLDTQDGVLWITALDSGTVLLPDLSDGARVYLTLGPGGVAPTNWARLRGLRLGGMGGSFPALTNIVQGIWLTNSAGLDAPLLAGIERALLDAESGSVLSLPAVRSYNAGTVQASSGGHVLLGNVVSCGGGSLSVTADGTDSRVDLPGLTNLAVSAGRVFSATATSGGFVGLGGLESISGASANFLSDGTGSVIDLSRLSGFITPLAPSSLVAQNGGVILINNAAVFLLANVAVTLPGVIAQPSPAVVLHGLAWHSYWIEQRDTGNEANPWRFFARVPQTNEFQTVFTTTPPHTAFRVWEFVADPPILDLWHQPGAPTVQLILYGATNQTYSVQATNSLPDSPAAWPDIATANMTNSFRVFPPAPMVDPGRFYRAKQL